MRTSLSFSVRRHFVDEFFRAHAYMFKPGTEIIDIGGRKFRKRGLFDIDASGARVTYLNSDPGAHPDILGDAEAISAPDASFDIAIMGELLEHVREPTKVIEEAHRVLRPGGHFLATVPFMYPVHADPHDHARYTDQHLRGILTAVGFTHIDIKHQGSWYAVFALAIQAYFRFPKRSRPARWIGKLVHPFIRFLLIRDRRAGPAERAWTTGFGIVAQK